MRPVCLLMIFLLFTLLYLIFLIKDKLIDLIERTFNRESSPYLACNDRKAFFTFETLKKYHAWSCQNVCVALSFLLDKIFIRFGTKLYRQVVRIPILGTALPVSNSCQGSRNMTTTPFFYRYFDFCVSRKIIFNNCQIVVCSRLQQA